MDRGCFSVSPDGLIPNEPFCPTAQEIKKPRKTKMHRTQVNKYRETLATGKALPGYHAVLLDSEASLAKLHRCPQIRHAQTSRKRPGHFYLTRISYLKTAEAKPSISAQIALKRLSTILNTWNSWIPPSLVTEEPQTLRHINTTVGGN